MANSFIHHPRSGFGYVRILDPQEGLSLFRDHLLRLDADSRHDRFNGYLDDAFVENYAARCATDGTIIAAYLENGLVRGAAELHPPEHSEDSVPEIAVTVELYARRRGVGSMLLRRLMAEARWREYRKLRVTTGAQNQAMRALAVKFGAQLLFRHGESTGTIEVDRSPQAEFASLAMDAQLNTARTMMNLNRACWKLVSRMYKPPRAA